MGPPLMFSATLKEYRIVMPSSQVGCRLGTLVLCIWFLAPLLERPAQAGLIDDLLNDYWTQTGELLPPSEWKERPRSDTGPVWYNTYGQAQGAWGCHHWPQLHLSDFHHQQGADVTCGYIDIFPLFPPTGVDPDGRTWICSEAPNVLVYTEPYNQGACFFTYGPLDLIINPFEPTCAQVNGATQAMNYLFAYYGYSETYSIDTVNDLRPSECLEPLEEVSIGDPDELTPEEVEQILSEIEKLYTDKGFLRTDRELADEQIPADILEQLMEEAEAGNLEQACATFAENVTVAEGQGQIKKLVIQSIIADIDIGTSIPIGLLKPSVTKVTYQILKYTYKALDTTQTKGGAKAYQTTVTNLALTQTKNVTKSQFPTYVSAFDSLGSAVKEMRKLEKLADTFEDRIVVRTANCVHAVAPGR